MRIHSVKYDLNGHTLILRNAEKTDAELLLSFYKRVCGETRFLLCEEDECTDFTMEEAEQYIAKYRDSEKACLILAEFDGKYVGNASFEQA